MSKDITYNGWRNYETWNVALWLGNDEGLYRLAREHQDYAGVRTTLRELGLVETPDKVAYNDSGLDEEALDELVRELRGEDPASEPSQPLGSWKLLKED